MPASQARATAYTYAREALSFVYMSDRGSAMTSEVKVCRTGKFALHELESTDLPIKLFSSMSVVKGEVKG